MLDALAALGFALLPAVSVLRPAASSEVTSAGVWLLSLAAALPLVARRLWPVPVFVFVLAVACLALPLGLAPTSFLAAAYALYLVAVTRTGQAGLSSVLVGGASAAGAVGLTMTGAQHYQGGTQAVQVVLGVLVLGATWAAGSAIRERRESTRRAIKQAAERATVEERLRIARDIHDVVANSVGLIAVKAGIANHLAASQPKEAHEALTVIEDVSRRALREMRATLAVLRQAQEDTQQLRPVLGLSDLPALVKTAEAAGVRVDLRSRYTEDPPEGVALAVFRIVQEALANVIKHAAPTDCRVRLVAAQGAMTVDVADDGPASAQRPAAPGGGLGLVGMRERAAAHGGVITAGPQAGGGFRVVATLLY
jgi:signal transduction histidine kinase